MAPKYGSALWVYFAAAMFTLLVVSQATASDTNGLKGSFERFQSLMNTANSQINRLISIDAFDDDWTEKSKRRCTKTLGTIDKMNAVAGNVLYEMNRLGEDFFVHHKKRKFYECYQIFQDIIGDRAKGLFLEASTQSYRGSFNPDKLIKEIRSFNELYSIYWVSGACKDFRP